MFGLCPDSTEALGQQLKVREIEDVDHLVLFPKLLTDINLTATISQTKAADETFPQKFARGVAICPGGAGPCTCAWRLGCAGLSLLPDPRASAGGMWLLTAPVSEARAPGAPSGLSERSES